MGGYKYCRRNGCVAVKKLGGGGHKSSNKGARNIYAGPGHPHGKMLRSRVLEMLFHAFFLWGGGGGFCRILKIIKRHKIHISGLRIYIDFFFIVIFILLIIRYS